MISYHYNKNWSWANTVYQPILLTIVYDIAIKAIYFTINSTVGWINFCQKHCI